MAVRLGSLQREEHRVRVFENKVLKDTVGPQIEEVMWDWRKLSYEKPHDTYSSPDITQMIKSMGWDGQVMWFVWGKRNACKVLVRKPEGKGPLARRKHSYYYYYYWYSALGPVWAETRVQSGDWYDSGMLHPGQVLRGSLPLLSPAF